jgi:hypothetical protein
VSCASLNNAHDSRGQAGVSRLGTWRLSIRRPTVSTVSFTKIVNALRCAKKRERVRIPGQWITEHIHGKPVRVWIPAQTRTVTVVRCHPRIVKRRERIGGHWVTRRVVLLPRRVRARTERVPFGTSTIVRGWLGTSGGDALGHQQVALYSAVNNGRQKYRLVAVATTAADGSWSARLPRGASRLVRAVFAGNPTAEPSISDAAHLIVRASITLSISPRSSHWGGTITLSGRLHGGYVPPAGEVVVLRIAWKGGATEIGHLYARRDGRFRDTYTFLRGSGTQTYELWATTGSESDYPFAPGRSRRVSVTVSP